MDKRKIKIGIDVGGTFTHAVAIDTADFSIVGKSCVPTSHSSKQGVAEGVVTSMKELLVNEKIDSDEVVLIAHSTTQATNALLEGDVANVGVITIGQGLEGKLAKSQTKLNDIYLAEDKKLKVYQEFIELDENFNKEIIKEKIRLLTEKGAEVLVATQTYGPEDSMAEKLVVECAKEEGIVATSASSLSQLYGIKIRTRTAIINAAMLPKMIGTANMTEQAVRESGIKAPLMVMRSDGGIMDINEMRKRPILTMLSGPAAGVTAALMYAKVTDGIFIEVGGTSSDISVIKNGNPQIKTAQIGGNRLSVNTLDIRTLGVGGGSVPRVSRNSVLDVGPRSAHIANLSYAAYSENIEFSNASIDQVQPLEGDPKDYLKLSVEQGDYTITPSGASYYLELVEEVGHGEANLNAVKGSVERAALLMDMEPEKLADTILKKCSNKIQVIIEGLLREYKLDRNLISFVGGGGGASAIVPHLSKQMNIEYSIADNSEVISAIGAALGMIREVVEKSIINPSDEDIKKLRNEAMESVIAMGALPESIDVAVEIDNANKRVKAVAMGSSDMNTNRSSEELDMEKLLDLVSENMKVVKSKTEFIASTNLQHIYSVERKKESFLSLLSSKIKYVVVASIDGVIKRKFVDCEYQKSTVGMAKSVLTEMLERLRSYGDGGELVPSMYIVVSGKIIDMSGLINASQITSMVDVELKDFNNDDQLVIVAEKKK